MNEFRYGSDGACWAYIPRTETDPEKLAEAERRFAALFQQVNRPTRAESECQSHELKEAK